MMLLAALLLAQATPTPMPCSDPFVPATVVQAVQPVTPSGQTLSKAVTIIVRAEIRKNGSVGRTRVVQSSGNAAFDKAAVVAIRASTYKPATHYCNPVDAAFGFKIVFDPRAPAGPTPRPLGASTACPVPFKEVTIVNNVSPDVDPENIGNGLVVLDITVDADGDFVKSTVVQSSGSVVLDQEAYNGAKRSSWSPKLVNCKPVEGHFTYRLRVAP